MSHEGFSDAQPNMGQRTPIAETAIYQSTAQLAEKYKAQRDKFAAIAKRIINNGIGFAEMSALEMLVEEVEQSL